MTDLEILAELKKSYNLIRDIAEHGCYSHCDGQLGHKQELKLENIINELEYVYETFYSTLDIKDLTVSQEANGDIIVISKFLEGGFDIYDKDYKNTGNSIPCADIDYYDWFDDYDFLTKEV